MFLSHFPISIALISSLLIGKVWAGPMLAPSKDTDFALPATLSERYGGAWRSLDYRELRDINERDTINQRRVKREWVSLDPKRKQKQSRKRTSTGCLRYFAVGKTKSASTVTIYLHRQCGSRDQGVEGELEESSNGIVDYWSSHLDDVESEEIVPSGHSATRDPETIKEAKRILRLRQGPILPITFRGDPRLNPACVSGRFSRLSHL
jgi:hypothetical protein